jgi:hypothetical protein
MDVGATPPSIIVSLVSWFSCAVHVVCLWTVPSSRSGENVVRLTISVVGSSHHDRDSKRSSFPHVLVGLRCRDPWPLLRLYGMATMDSTPMRFLPTYDEPIMA